MRHKLKKLNKIIYCLVATLFFAAPQFVQAGEILDITFQNEPMALFANANFLPGEDIGRWVRVENKTADSQPIAVKAINVTDDGLGNQLELTVSRSGNELYKDYLNDFFQAGEVYLETISGNATVQYDFVVSFQTSAGNAYQGKSLGFDIMLGSQAGESIGSEFIGGSSGYQFLDLIISDEGGTVSDTAATITWLTNKIATSRVIYDTVTHPDIGGTIPPNYGYAFSTIEDTTKVTGHSVTINDLLANTTYYYRPLSKASPEKYGRELSFKTTNNPDEVIVLGESGQPELKIEKTVKAEYANPGDSKIEYEVLVKNIGNMQAFSVSMNDVLPAGFTFSDSNETQKSWALGDIGSGKYKSVTYVVDIDSEIKLGVYTNTAVAFASNHSEISASADLELRKISVLSLDFVKSGFNKLEFIGLVLLVIILLIIIKIIRSKIKK